MELELLFPLILVVYAKYTTEKAFDLMASLWNKFNCIPLRGRIKGTASTIYLTHILYKL